MQLGLEDISRRIEERYACKGQRSCDVSTDVAVAHEAFAGKFITELHCDVKLAAVAADEDFVGHVEQCQRSNEINVTVALLLKDSIT